MKTSIHSKDDNFIINQWVAQSCEERLSEVCKFVFFSALTLVTFGRWIPASQQLNHSWKRLKSGKRHYQAKVDVNFLKTYQVIKGRLINPYHVANKLRHFIQIKNDNLKIDKAKTVDILSPGSIKVDSDALLKPFVQPIIKQIQPPKDIHCLPADILKKIFQESLQSKERAHVSATCLKWETQIKTVRSEEKLIFQKYIEGIISDLDPKEFESEINRLKNICYDERNSTLKEWMDKAQKNIYNMFIGHVDKLKNNFEIVKASVSHYGLSLRIMCDEWKNNSEIVKAAMNQNASAFKFASIELKGDLEIVKTAIAKNGKLLAYASNDLKGHPELIKIAVNQNGEFLEYIPIELRDDDVVKSALKQNGLVLKVVSLEQKNNVDIVKVAVAQNGLALEFASEDIKKNLEVVKIAISQNKQAIQYAAETVRDHFDNLHF